MGRKHRKRATKNTLRECPFCHETSRRYSLTCPTCGVAAPHPRQVLSEEEHREGLQLVDEDDRSQFGGLALEHGWCGLEG